MKFFDELLDIFYPTLCCACEITLAKNEEVICFKCRSVLPKTNFRNFEDNEMMSRFSGRIMFRYAFAFLYFHKSGITQILLHKLKYKNHPEIGELFGIWLGNAISDSAINDFDLIIPVPLHPKKLRKRHYNQSSYFAKGISEALNKPVMENILVRRTYNLSQTKQTREQRWQSVSDAFATDAAAELHLKKILLVDDVVTTGATLEACGNQLYKSGASSVSIAALALAK